MGSGLANRLRDAAIARADVKLMYVTPAAKMAPTLKATLDQIEKDIQAPLHPLVRELYLGAQEFGLAWYEGTASPLPEPDKHVTWKVLSNNNSDVYEGKDRHARGGIVNILPAAEAFQKGFWIDRVLPEPCGDQIEIDGRTLLDSTFYGDVYPFDFIDGYAIVGLWYDRSREDWRVALGDDRGADWTVYRTISVPEYFAQLERGLGGRRTWVRADAEKVMWALEASSE